MWLAAQVDSVLWNDGTDMLVALADGKLLVWYYPNVVNVDHDLIEKTKHIQDAG